VLKGLFRPLEPVGFIFREKRYKKGSYNNFRLYIKKIKGYIAFNLFEYNCYKNEIMVIYIDVIDKLELNI